ncbi:hypothetical protein ABC855_g2042 [[Candida] zeylanoides]
MDVFDAACGTLASRRLAAADAPLLVAEANLMHPPTKRLVANRIARDGACRLVSLARIEAPPDDHVTMSSVSSDDESIMDIVSGSPSLYDEAPVHYYVRDSLVEISHHHRRIGRKFAAVEASVSHLRRQSGRDLAALRALADSNATLQCRMASLHHDLRQIEALLGKPAAGSGAEQARPPPLSLLIAVAILFIYLLHKA